LGKRYVNKHGDGRGRVTRHAPILPQNDGPFKEPAGQPKMPSRVAGGRFPAPQAYAPGGR